jgi:hypothetical protein
MVDFIGKPGETRKIEKAEPVESTETEFKTKEEKPSKSRVQESPKKTQNKASAKKSEKNPAEPSSKRKKTTEKKSSSTKKPS